jgi:phage-related holin
MLILKSKFKSKRGIMKTTQAVELISLKAIGMNFLYIPLVLFINQFAEQIMILTMFMVIDFTSGLGKSYVMHEKFSLHRALAGVLTKLFTICIPFLLHFTSNGVGEYADQVKNLISYGFSVLIIIEVYSILGNIYAIRTGTELEDKDLLSWFILNIRKFFETFIKTFKSM